MPEARGANHLSYPSICERPSAGGRTEWQQPSTAAAACVRQSGITIPPHGVHLVVPGRAKQLPASTLEQEPLSLPTRPSLSRRMQPFISSKPAPMHSLSRDPPLGCNHNKRSCYLKSLLYCSDGTSRRLSMVWEVCRRPWLFLR